MGCGVPCRQFTYQAYGLCHVYLNSLSKCTITHKEPCVNKAGQHGEVHFNKLLKSYQGTPMGYHPLLRIPHTILEGAVPVTLHNAHLRVTIMSCPYWAYIAFPPIRPSYPFGVYHPFTSNRAVTHILPSEHLAIETADGKSTNSSFTIHSNCGTTHLHQRSQSANTEITIQTDSVESCVAGYR